MTSVFGAQVNESTIKEKLENPVPRVPVAETTRVLASRPKGARSRNDLSLGLC